MNKYLLSLALICSCIAPLGAMGDDKKIDLGSLKKYVNVKRLFLGIGAALADDDTEEADKEEVVKALLKAVKIGELPLTVKDRPNAKVEDFFDVRNLQRFLEATLVDYVNGDFCREQYSRYIRLFRRALKMDEVRAIMEDIKFAELDSFLDGLENFYRDNADNEASIDSFIDFDHLPEFLSTIIDDYFYLQPIKALCNAELNNRAITKEALLDCINFKPLFSSYDYAAYEIPGLGKGVRGLIAMLLDWAKDEKKGLKTLLNSLAMGYTVRQVACNYPQAGAAGSSHK